MAIYHCSVKVISRSSGRSAVGASAYRSGEKIENERDGIIHDYTNKSGIEHTEVQVPDNAPEWASDRDRLWNEVEKIEKAKNSQLAREVEVALPKELSKDEQVELVRDYVKENFVNKGMVADIAIHDKGDGNPHAHIMLTMRPFQENGEWGSRYKKEYILDKEGNKIIDKKGNAKANVIPSTDWNTKESLEQWRENWAKCTNKHLERYGIEQRIDHRSYEAQGISKAPTVHEGHIVRAMEKKGLETEIGGKNKLIAQDNKKIELLDRQIQSYEKQKEREIADGRNGTYGDQDRSIGAERTGRETITDVLIKPSKGTYQVDSSRAINLDQQGKQGNRGISIRQKESTEQGRRGTEVTYGNSRESQQDIQGNQTRNERPQQEQQREIGKYTYQDNQSNSCSGEDLQRNNENVDRPNLRSETDTQTNMERTSQTVFNEPTHNDGANSRNSGSISPSNTFNDILKGLEKSIEKANAIEKAEVDKQAKALERKMNKPVKSKSRSWERDR